MKILILRSYKTMKPEVVIKSNLIENAREYTIGTPLTANPDSLSKGNNMKAVQEGFLKCAIPAIRSHIDNSNNRFLLLMNSDILKVPAFNSRLLYLNF